MKANQIPWTPQQDAFFLRLQDTDDPLILTAVAGSGKTTTLVEGVRYLRGTVLAVAFNVKIKKTLEEKIGSIATCKTLNGLGHGAMLGFFGRGISIDPQKVGKITSELLKDPKLEDYRDLWSPIRQLASQAKHQGIIPNGTPGLYSPLTPDTDEAWQAMADHYDIECDTTIIALARKVLRVSNTAAWQGKCDFDDQIYIPTCWGANFDKFDNVIVDEAQDLSEIQHKMLKKALSKNGRLIAVGDHNQAIYGWRGAMSNSIEKLTEEFALEPMELTVSFRCAKNIVREAKKVVPRIEWSPDSPEGKVSDLETFSVSTFKYGDAILCRNNAPLIKMAYRLIFAGTGVHFLGRDIGAGLKALIKTLRKRKAVSNPEQLLIALEDWKETQISVATAKGEYGAAEKINDKAGSLEAVIQGSGATNIEGVLREIDRLFGKNSAPITLSTIHRAKGLEWQRVFFLDSHLIPSRWTKKAVERDPVAYAWMEQEERNILYVGRTRAILALAYINSEDWNREEKTNVG